jgi:hypothetical protein
MPKQNDPILLEPGASLLQATFSHLGSSPTAIRSAKGAQIGPEQRIALFWQNYQHIFQKPTNL